MISCSCCAVIQTITRDFDLILCRPFALHHFENQDLIGILKSGFCARLRLHIVRKINWIVGWIPDASKNQINWWMIFFSWSRRILLFPPHPVLGLWVLSIELCRVESGRLYTHATVVVFLVEFLHKNSLTLQIHIDILAIWFKERSWLNFILNEKNKI